MSRVSTLEQETTIQFDRTGKTATIWTSDTNMIARLDKLVKEFPDVYKIIAEHTMQGEISDKQYEVSQKKLVYPKKPRPQMPEEQRQKARERLLKYRSEHE